MSLSVKPKNLIQGNVPRPLKEEFDLQRDRRKWETQTVIEAMATLWVHLREESQFELHIKRVDIPRLAAQVDKWISDARRASEVIGVAQEQTESPRRKKPSQSSAAG